MNDDKHRPSPLDVGGVLPAQKDPLEDDTKQRSTPQRDIDRHRAESAELRKLLADRDHEIDALLKSTSWRVTAPLRAVGRWLAKSRLIGRSSFVRPRETAFRVDRLEYERWVRDYSSITPAARVLLASCVEDFASRPIISIILPSYNIGPHLLTEAIESVLRQIYPFWELCISDDASTTEGVCDLLKRFASKDPRIKVNFRAKNGNISANSNDALALASGDYVALLDADDLLSEDALFWVANEIANFPAVDLIYSDEDKFDGTQGRFDPHFKTAWNPALMLSQNAFSHLGVFRRSLVEKVGRFREGYEGAQDYDLVLRCADATTPDRIRHIPRILYHWRATPGSTAQSMASKPYAWRAGREAIEQHLKRRGIAGHVEVALGDYYQVKFDAMDPPPLVSIIMPTTLGNPITRACLESVLKRTSYRNFELLVLATEEHLAAARGDAKLATTLADPRIRLQPHHSAPFNYSEVNNAGVAAANGQLVCFLNDDVEVIGEDWLEQLVARVTLEGVGGASPMLYYPSGKIQHAGVLLGVGGVADHAFRNLARGQVGYFARSTLEQDYSCLTAACLLVRRQVFEAAGGFDVRLPVAFNDVDLCIRIRRMGSRLIWTPAAQMCHHESLTFGVHNAPTRQAQFSRDVDLMRERWQPILDNDPYYNPNLSLDPGHQFQMMTPPRLAHPPSYLPSGPLAADASRIAALP